MDEAGRGAVLGPLVVAGVWTAPEHEEKLKTLGARDSKTLSRKKRKEVLRALWQEGLRGRVIIIPPHVIDQENLTILELGAMAKILREVQPTQVILDPPVGPRAIPHFLRNLSRATKLPESVFSAFPQADKKSPVVGAASILAKVVRDGYMEALHRQFGDIGWGYPGEKKVQDFLERWFSEHRDLPDISRKRWRCLRAFYMQGLHDSA